MPKHKKFINERICDGCRCNFLPEKGYEKVQKNCRGCAELPEPPKKVEQGESIAVKQATATEVINTALENVGEGDKKVTYCKKCGKPFTPTAPANKVCPNCK